jgi:glycosyltransferase involved in cell wall biosynthesis
MKILWVTNVIIGDMCEKLNISHPSSGGWMEALLHDFKDSDQDELIILTTTKQKELSVTQNKNIKYYVLPCGYISKFDYKNSRNINFIKSIIGKEKPELLHIWGTEFTLGLAVQKCCEDIPSIIYIQGIVEAIARYYEAGMSRKELVKAISFRDIIKRDWILAQKNKYIKRAKLESEIIGLSGNIISENMWCNTHCKAIFQEVKTHFCQLSIRKEFEEYEWNLSKVRKYTIMCNASGYPLKGLHILLKALKLVVKRYPQVKLYIPGTKLNRTRGIKYLIKRTGYTKYICSLIKENDLENNVVFLGVLTPNQMAENMAKANIFVVPSALENHSSTLKEAMLVGTPCIASSVGGVPEYVRHGVNGFLYRFEEYELLAEYICHVFGNEELAVEISINARLAMLKTHNSENISETILNIYKEIISSKVM